MYLNRFLFYFLFYFVYFIIHYLYFIYSVTHYTNIGDGWCVAAAIASAMFILRLEKFSRENDAAELSGVSFSAVSVLCGLWVGLDYWKATAEAVIARPDLNTANFNENTANLIDNTANLIDNTANLIQNAAQSIDDNIASSISNFLQVRL